MGGGLGVLAGGLSGLGLLTAGKLTRAASRADQRALQQDIPQLDPTTRQMIAAQRERAARPEAVFEEEQMANVPQEAQLRAAQAQAQQAAGSLGGEQAVLGQALGQRANRAYGAELANMRRNVRLNAPLQRYEQLARSSDLDRAQAAAEAGAYHQANQQHQMQRLARGQVVGQVLGLFGKGAGMALGVPSVPGGGGGAAQTPVPEVSAMGSAGSSGAGGGRGGAYRSGGQRRMERDLG